MCAGDGARWHNTYTQLTRLETRHKAAVAITLSTLREGYDLGTHIIGASTSILLCSVIKTLTHDARKPMNHKADPK